MVVRRHEAAGGIYKTTREDRRRSRRHTSTRHAGRQMPDTAGARGAGLPALYGHFAC